MAAFRKFLTGLLVAVLVLLLVSEFGLRWFIGNQLTSAVEEQAREEGVALTEDPKISFGAYPLVFSVPGGTIPSVTVDIPSTLQISGTEILGQPSMNLQLDELRITGDSPVAGHMVATTLLTDEYLTAVVKQSMAQDGTGLVEVTGVRSNTAENALDVEFAGGLADLQVRPVPVDGRLNLDIVSGSLFGIGLPQQLTDVITMALREGVDDATQGFRVDEFTVIEGGSRLTVSGDDVALSEVADAGRPLN